MLHNSGRRRCIDLSFPMAVAAVLAGAGPALADPAPAPVAETSDALIIQAKDHAELNEKWCAANPNVEHIFVLPASLFVDSQQLVCNGSIYKLYRVIENDDPDDFEYFLDPPFGHTTRLGCDGKAGRTMQTIAVNCRPLKPRRKSETWRHVANSIPIGAGRSSASPCSAPPAWSPLLPVRLCARRRSYRRLRLYRPARRTGAGTSQPGDRRRGAQGHSQRKGRRGGLPSGEHQLRQRQGRRRNESLHQGDGGPDRRTAPA